jgi:hypothetical protein
MVEKKAGGGNIKPVQSGASTIDNAPGDNLPAAGLRHSHVSGPKSRRRDGQEAALEHIR